MGKLKNTLIAFYICLPLVIALRTIQLLFMVDPQTGFALEENFLGGTMGTVLVSFMFLGLVAVLLLLSRLAGAWPSQLPQNSPVVGVIALVLSLCNMYELVRVFGEQMGQGNRVVNVALILFVILSSAYYFLLGLSCLVRFALPPVCSLIPVVFHVLLLISTFMKYTALANVSENSYDIACLCLMLVFSLQYAKLSCGYQFMKTSRYIYGVGLSAALLCVMITLPRYIILLTGRGESLHNTLTLSPYLLVYAVFMVVFLSRNFKSPFRDQVDKDEKEEDPVLYQPAE